MRVKQLTSIGFMGLLLITQDPEGDEAAKMQDLLVNLDEPITFCQHAETIFPIYHYIDYDV